MSHRRTTIETPTGVRVSLHPAAEAYAFLGPDVPVQRIAVTEVTLREGELLVEVELAMLCPTDFDTAAGRIPGTVAQVLGHEQVGRIVASGPGDPPITVDGIPLAMGDRIVWATRVACGDCAACLDGLPDACTAVRRYGHERVRRGWELSGGLATHVHLIAGTAIVRARDWIPAGALAPASCAVATAAAVVEAAERMRPLAGETVAVSGCGPRGLAAIALSSERGARVIGLDRDPARRTLAREFGASVVAADGGAEHPHRVALEFTGDPDVTARLTAHTDVGGVIVLARAAAGDAPVGVENVSARGLTIRGVAAHRPEHLLDAVRYIERSDHTLWTHLIDETVRFAEAADVLTTSASARRVAVTPG